MSATRGVSLWDRFVGPVLLFDLLRLTRRGATSIFLVRVFYLGTLLLAIVLFCAIELGLHTPAQFIEAARDGIPVPTSKAASFASHLFFALLGLELAMVVLLTPAYVAGAIAEDSERKIMDYLLASDLSNREIVLGKWLARLAHLVLLLLTGLPLLAVAQVLGGVHPIFLVTGFVVALLTMVSLGALSILESIVTRRPHRAILHIYLGFGIYLLLSTGLAFTVFLTRSVRAESMPDRGGLICFSLNPLFPLLRLYQERGYDDWPNGILAEALTDCAVINGLISFGCLGLAINCLRSYLGTSPLSRQERLALRLQKLHAGLKTEAARKLAALAHRHDASVPVRPPLEERPILWKELYVETAPVRIPREMRKVSEIVVRILTIILGSTFPVLLLIKIVLGSPKGEMWVAVLGISFFLLLLLVAAIAVRASGCLSVERERNTLDALLTTSIDRAAIINEKWLGSLLAARHGAILLAVGWLACALFGLFAWQALPFLLLVGGSWMCLAASVGLFCSLMSRATWRAMAMAMGILLVVGVFPWFMGWPDLTPFGMLRTVMNPQFWINRLTVGSSYSEDHWYFAGIFLYSALAVFFWRATHSLFPRITGRMQ